MTGQELKERLKMQPMSQKDIADALGITPQSLVSIFGNADVKSGVIEKIASIVGRPLSWFYDQHPTTYITASADGAIVTGDSNLVGSILGEPYTYGQQSGATVTIPTSVLLLLQRQLEEKDQQIAQLLRQLSRQ